MSISIEEPDEMRLDRERIVVLLGLDTFIPLTERSINYTSRSSTGREEEAVLRIGMLAVVCGLWSHPPHTIWNIFAIGLAFCKYN